MHLAKLILSLPPLQAAKLIRSGDIGAEGRRKVFDAVGFNFLNRLLATSECVYLLTEQSTYIILQSLYMWYYHVLDHMAAMLYRSIYIYDLSLACCPFLDMTIKYYSFIHSFITCIKY